MSDSIDDLPEIQVEEILGEEETPAPKKVGAELPEIDIDFEAVYGNSAAGESPSGPVAAASRAPAFEPSRAPSAAALTPGTGEAMQRASYSAPEDAFEPQFDLDPELTQIPSADGTTGALATRLPEVESAPGGTAGIGVTELPAPTNTPAGVERVDQDSTNDRRDTADDFAIDLDAIDAEAPPILPSAFKVPEAPPTAHPAVEPVSDAAADLDAMLFDLGMSQSGDQTAAGGEGPLLDSQPARTETTATAPEAVAVDQTSAPEFDEEAANGPSPLEESMASAASAAHSLDEAPALPPPTSATEPTPIPGIDLVALRPDAETLETLQKLAGAAVEPEAMRVALHAALKGEPYRADALPDARAFMVGVVRVLVSTGYSVNELVDAIMAALDD